jgi:hypothetical protein
MVRAPVLWPSILTPPEEVGPIKDLYAQLCGVVFNVDAWASSLRLYQFSNSTPPGVTRADARQWKFIATNECALQLHHLRERLERISGYFLRPCTSLGSRINTSQMRAARKMLDDHFPDIDMLRHAIAHAGRIEATPKGQAPEEAFALTGFKEGDRFATRYEGAVRSLDITRESLEQITTAATTFLGAFAAAAKALEEEGHLE